MRKSFHPALTLLLLAVAVGAGLFGIHRYRYRFVRTSADLVRRLPAGDATVFFADVEMLRRAGLVQSLSGTHDGDYLAFVRSTSFEWSRDLDALAGTYADGEWRLLLRGRFRISELRRYAKSHGGSCDETVCLLPGTERGRWVGFGELQPDVLAVASGTKRSAVDSLLTQDPAVLPAADEPAVPLWIRPAHKLLLHPETLPVALRLLAAPLVPASDVVLSANRPGRASDAFSLHLKAEFPSSSVAQTAHRQFENGTRLLRSELAREHAQPSATDLTGVLTEGEFRSSGIELSGVWPVPKKLLDALR